MLPRVNISATQAHLDEISLHVARNAHGDVLMDRAGWHTTVALKMPHNLTIILLLSRSPELNPMRNIWQFTRQTWLSNRVFDSYGHYRGWMRCLEQTSRRITDHQINRHVKMGAQRSNINAVGIIPRSRSDFPARIHSAAGHQALVQNSILADQAFATISSPPCRSAHRPQRSDNSHPPITPSIQHAAAADI